ncbi:HlyD family secretion protein [Solimonas terrae]|uniref:HlyD family efflux transporter periplasmic adaptor subunit n=1 Tax=Solimonas terrae TaxID=1396819 RepID=A0A6M2BRZ7_9GAMM|nr:efflux RND transporter periplasmic adaptor subunit [Solimonas terrae]NGY04767.1 HlyD family efflux transporter periplasmic adaptor subunit [Solimonas terrae]
MNTQNAAVQNPPSNGNGTRRRRLLIVAALVVLGLIAYAAYWLLHGRYFESTDDAYAASDLVQISSEVAGTVTSVHVDDTQHVERGQLLVELDPADAEVAESAAEAELARTVRTVRGLFSRSSGLKAQMRSSEISLQAARGDLKRRLEVAADGGVSSEELQHARDRVAQLEAQLATTQEDLATNNAQIENTTVADHPQVLAAAAKVREAALALKRTKITAPLSGTVARRGVQIGARIAPGAPLMAVVPLDQAWVEANFKEVQLEKMRVGQPAEVHADLYGGDVTYHGHVAGLGAGSGSAFALLPAQNASGNWIKIVQRVPVRIALDAAELQAHPLRVGLSMDVQVDLHDTSGPLIATEVRTGPQQVVASEEYDAAVDRLVADIIARNGGGDVATGAAAGVAAP